MLEVCDVTKAFGLSYALRNVNLEVSAGETVFLVGPNGAGKTTFLRIIATLIKPTTGSIHMYGQDIWQADVSFRNRIGYISHNTLLYDELTARQNLTFYGRMYGLSEPEDRITSLIEKVGLENRANDLVRTFSRGMKQRLSIARAVLHKPQLLLLDEPYTGLDIVATESLTELLQSLAGEGCSILMTTHHVSSSLFAPDRAVVLRQGRVIYDESVKDVDAFAKTYRQLLYQNTTTSTNNVIVGKQENKIHNHDRQTLLFPQVNDESGESEISKYNTPSFFKQALSLVIKDMTVEFQSRELMTAMLVYAVLALLIFSFALDLRGAVTRSAAPGVLWATVVFAGTLGLSRSITQEHTTGTIEGLLLVPAERAFIWLGKSMSIFLIMFLMELVLIPLATVMFNVSFIHPGIVLVFLVGTAGYAAVGTLLAIIAVNTRAREVMLPILLLPLLVPLLIGSVEVTNGLVEGAMWSEVAGWIRNIVLYDFVVVAVSLLTFPYIVEE